jgi:hypothetical protein
MRGADAIFSRGHSMHALRHRADHRSPLSRTLSTSLGVAALAAAGLAAPLLLAPLDMSGWTLFDPDDDWTVTHPTATSVRLVEQVTSSSAHPAWVVSDVILSSVATIEFYLSVGAGTGDDDLMGFGFSFLDGSHSWLLDWKKNSQSFNWGQAVAVNDDLAEQGLKIKRIDGSYTWDGLWGGTDGLGVSTIAGPAGGAWFQDTVYHFVLELSPGHIVVTRDGVPLFDVSDPSYPGATGAIACYSFSQNLTTLANVVITTPTWTDLGLGKAGVAGVPVLAGSGPLAASSANQLQLTNAAPAAPTTLIFGLSAINAPFKGGTLVPHPLLPVALATNGAGTLTLPFAWPVGVPAGLSFYFQCWTQDAGATFGLSASNGLVGVSS